METREAALCVFRRRGQRADATDDQFLFVEIGDSTKGLLHRPPGGGMEPGETPEVTVRRELQEELELTLTSEKNLAFIDHIWFWNGRDVQERAWIFLADASEYPTLETASTLLEADGQQHSLVWRKLIDPVLPPVCPASISAFLQAKLKA